MAAKIEANTSYYPKILLSADTSDLKSVTSDYIQDFGAVMAINGGYFNMTKTPAGHVGLLMFDSQVFEPATRSVKRGDKRFQTARAGFAILEDNTFEIAWLRTNGDTLFAWQTNPLNNELGNPDSSLDFSKAQILSAKSAIGAGPMLISNGKIQVTSTEEVFFGTSIPAIHPRTAIGYTKNNELILLVVDGRQEQSRGVDLNELAGIMADLGAFEAVNLDGGGSSTMVVNDTLLNRPAGNNIQREVMSAIGIFKKE